MERWQPRTIRRFVDGFPTSARTALVDTDAGLAYLKAMGGPEGPHTLASEVVATQLAAWFGLPTFDWAIVPVDEVDEIPFLDKDKRRIGNAIPGPAFVTRAEQGKTWSGNVRDLKKLVNPSDVSKLVVFDTWVLNCDRHVEAERRKPRRKPNYDNVFLSAEAPAGQFLLKAMDHTHCFTCGRAWTRKMASIDIVQDGGVYGLFPAFGKVLDRTAVVQAASQLCTFTRETVDEMVQRIPDEWSVAKEAKEALIELAVRRAMFVGDTIETRLWPQNELPFSESDDGSHRK